MRCCAPPLAKSPSPGASARASSAKDLVINAAQARAGLRIFEEACAHVDEWGPGAFAGLVGQNEAGPDSPEGA